MERGRIPNRLKQYRRRAGYSQKKVARILKLRDASMLSRWEHGVAVPMLSQVFMLASIYNILPHELYDELWNRIASEFNLLAPHESDHISQSF